VIKLHTYMQVLLAFTSSHVNSIYFHAPSSVGNFQMYIGFQIDTLSKYTNNWLLHDSDYIGFAKIRCQQAGSWRFGIAFRQTRCKHIRIRPRLPTLRELGGEGPNRWPQGGEWELQIRFRKTAEKKSQLHPTHLKQWVLVPHSSGRLSALGILTHNSQNTLAEAKRWKAHTKLVHSHKHTKSDQRKITKKKISQVLKQRGVSTQRNKN